MVKWLGLGMVCALAACGSDEGGDAMGEEVGGGCVYTPGSYVISYEIIDMSDTCGDEIDPKTEEYVTVRSNGTLSSAGFSSGIDGCTGERVMTGCHLSFDAHCELTVSGGRAEADRGIELDYSNGTGVATTTIRLYYGTETLPTTCRMSEEVTIHRR